MEDQDKIYWIRVSAAIVAGFLSAAAYIFNLLEDRGFLIGILFYLISYYVSRYFLGIKVDKEKNITPRTLFFNGIGTYIILWLFLWILLINLV
jgi:hypothetical protein